MKRILKTGCLTIVVIFLIIIAIGYFNSSSTEKEKEDVVKVEEPEMSSGELYLKAETYLEDDNFAQANMLLGRILEQDSSYSKIDTLRFEIKNKYEAALKVVDEELVSLKRETYSNHDEFKNITWRHPKSSKGTYGNRIYTYFGEKNGVVFKPRLVIRYMGDNWLFFNKVVFLIDGVSYDFNLNTPDRDNSGGSVWETSDEELSDSSITILKKMYNAKEVKYRLIGKQYVKDFTLSRARITDIENNLRYQYILDNHDKILNFKLN